MALRYYQNANGPSSVPELVLVGDGVSTSINIDFTTSPFNFDYKGNKPVEAKSVNPGAVDVVLNADRISVTITTPSVLTDGQTLSIGIELLFLGQ